MSEIEASFVDSASALLRRFEAGERLFLWGFRAMARRYRFGRPTLAEMREVYWHFGVEDAVPLLDALIGAFARAAHAPIETHSPGCPCVSPSERSLLRAAAAAQTGALAIARGELGQWLPDLTADWATEPLRGLGGLFQAAGLNLPLRERELASAPETMALRTWPAASPTLH
jgi:hypothetical protein